MMVKFARKSPGMASRTSTNTDCCFSRPAKIHALGKDERRRCGIGDNYLGMTRQGIVGESRTSWCGDRQVDRRR